MRKALAATTFLLSVPLFVYCKEGETQRIPATKKQATAPQKPTTPLGQPGVILPENPDEKLPEPAPKQSTDPTEDEKKAPPVEVKQVPDSLVNEKWEAFGQGIAKVSLSAAPSQNIFIAYAGYSVELSWSKAWVSELYRQKLKTLGIKYIYAAKGPRDVGYESAEIENSKLAKDVLAIATKDTKIVILAHSSGAFVAHEFLQKLFTGKSAEEEKLHQKISYFNLDGAGRGLTNEIVGKLKKLYPVSAFDSKTGTPSFNAGPMKALAETFPSKAKAIVLDASGSGCQAGSERCMHDTLINTRPHSPTNFDLEKDYQNFKPPHAVVTKYLDVLEAAL
jgi:hypothetical protein